MTQQELIDIVNVTRQTIIAIESGKYSSSFEQAFRIATVFAAPLEDIYKFHPEKEIRVKGEKRLFLKLGSCSHTPGFIVNCEFGHLKEAEERAPDPLSGGIIIPVSPFSRIPGQKKPLNRQDLRRNRWQSHAQLCSNTS